MTKQEYSLIAESIWRSGFIKDKNKIRQEARQRMRRLIAYDLSASLGKLDPNFDIEQFINDCQL